MRVGDPPVGGRYSLVESFGADERFAGGKVQTWHARDSLVERDVVLRVITPGGNSAKLVLDRALEMSLVAHPGLGVVYEAVDHGEYAIVVCEWVQGTSLTDTLEAHGPLSPAVARKTLADVAEAITVAHHAGLPIGGLIPERVILRDNGSVAVSAVPALFADERGDIRQLGELLFTALTGEQPDLDDADVARHLPRTVPRDLAVLCQRAMETDPSRQLGSAAAFAAVLRPRNRPQSRPKESAGRTGGRLGGLDPAPNPITHDTDLVVPSQPRTVAIPVSASAAAANPQTKPSRTAPPAAATAASPGAASASAAPPTVAIPATNGPQTTDEIPVRRAAAASTARAAAAPVAPQAPVPVLAPLPPPSPPSPGESAAPAGTSTSVAGTGSPADYDDNYVFNAFRGRRQDSAIDTGEDYDQWEDTGSWGSYDEAEDDPDTGSSEGSQIQRKVLLYAVPLVALLLVIALVVIVGKQFSEAVTDDGSGAVLPPVGSSVGVEPTEAGAEPSEGGEEPAASGPLAPTSAAVFNPFGDGQPEHDDEVGLAYDGDAASAWTTLTYQNTPEFGNLKPGVGLIFDLGAEYAISTVELATNMPGTAIEVRTGAAPDAALDSYPVIGTLDPFAEAGSVELAEPVRARFVIVWFVRLVEANGGFQGALAECRILGS